MIRRLAPLVLLVVVAVAGCIGGAPADTQAPGNDSPEVIEDPDNYTYVDNASFATGGHVHDYWDGQEQVTVLDKADAGTWTWFGPPEPIATFRSDAGKVVPQGTERVEVEVDWTEEPGTIYEDVELWVRTADDANATAVTEVQPGDVVTIDSTNDQNDLPHRTLSSWEFQYVVDGVDVGAGPAMATEYLRFNGEFSMTVTAHRGLELPVYPAHPDQWNDRSEIPLFEAQMDVQYNGNPSGDWACFGGDCPVVHRPDNGTIVPFNAAKVRIEFTYTSQEPVTDMAMKYHAADTWEWTTIEPDTTDGDTRIYEIPVSSGMGDTPYATQSLWEIVPYPTQPEENGWALGEYTISATAMRDAAS